MRVKQKSTALTIGVTVVALTTAVSTASIANTESIAPYTSTAAGSEEFDDLSARAADALDSLDVVPGLIDSVVEDGEGVSVDSAQQQVSVDLGSGRSIAMEKVSSGADRSEQVGGNSILIGTETDTDTILQSHDNAARIVEVLNSPDAPTSYSYDLDLPAGSDILPQEDGSIVLGKEDRTEDGEQVLEIEGMVGAPWAVDANGEPVPARYERDDNRLTMILDPSSDAEYPIVADPVITGGGFRVIYPTYPVLVQLNKARTGDAQDVGSAVCIGILFVPVVGPAIAAACGLSNIALRTTYRYGYCQYWSISSPTRVTVGLYKGGWCS